VLKGFSCLAETELELARWLKLCDGEVKAWDGLVEGSKLLVTAEASSRLRMGMFCAADMLSKLCGCDGQGKEKPEQEKESQEELELGIKGNQANYLFRLLRQWPATPL
jgi:hypothetical protein